MGIELERDPLKALRPEIRRTPRRKGTLVRNRRKRARLLQRSAWLSVSLREIRSDHRPRTVTGSGRERGGDPVFRKVDV